MINIVLHLLALGAFILFIVLLEMGIREKNKEDAKKTKELFTVVSLTQSNFRKLKEYSKKPLLSKDDRDFMNYLYKTIDEELLFIKKHLKGGFSMEQEQHLQDFFKNVGRDLAVYMVENEEDGEEEDE